jgi:serine/threonine protein phosphatase PrpC
MEIPIGKRKLAMTRSVGDFLYKDKGVICDPIIKHIPFPETSFSLIVATDGLWDCWKEEEIHLLVQDDSLSDTHLSKAFELFGSNRDDTLIFTLDISIDDESSVACSGTGDVFKVLLYRTTIFLYFIKFS